MVQQILLHGEGEAIDMPLITPDKGGFEHFIRDALRSEQWWQLDLRRAGFDCVRKGVDRAATMTLNRRLHGLDHYRWRCILAGAVATMPRLCRWHRVDTPICQACGQEEETCEHIFTRCPAYDEIRYREIEPHVWDWMPDCLKQRGLMPCGLELVNDHNLSNDEVGRAFLASTVQYTLLDILAERQRHLPPELAPQPRWQRNVRPRQHPAAPAAPQPGPHAAPEQPHHFVHGGELRTANGEHLR